MIDKTRMSCLAVPLVPAGVRRRQADNSTLNISYTVVMDNAPGPDLSNSLLQLNVLPDPVIGDLNDPNFSAVIGINVSLCSCNMICHDILRLSMILYIFDREPTWILYLNQSIKSLSVATCVKLPLSLKIR